MERNDIIGAACAVVAIGIITFLSLDSWAIADCRTVLREAEFQRAGALEPDAAADLAAFRAQLEGGAAGPEAAACVDRIGLPF
ncbi:MAG: hypothetical protein V7651_15335 [Hyphomonas oceanitis]|uniref:Uncharacterized protein n=1 Tax=Hyphomonas oceanitis SCH89 TaxID=1280953 RepID=A0A059G3V7_9PROT|nr:hypothetical protein [Hyphomonas oceanitis]KDA01481.1 hypothetical protein HOC_15492 [Hyphomonas oceanitis SCH89]